MDCKEFVKKIPDFLNQKMDYPTMKEFVEHLNECKECEEELSIQFLVTEGVARLENGNVFDLQKELKQRLETARRRLDRDSMFITTGTVLEVLGMCALAAVIIWILL